MDFVEPVQQEENPGLVRIWWAFIRFGPTAGREQSVDFDLRDSTLGHLRHDRFLKVFSGRFVFAADRERDTAEFDEDGKDSVLIQLRTLPSLPSFGLKPASATAANCFSAVDLPDPGAPMSWRYLTRFAASIESIESTPVPNLLSRATKSVLSTLESLWRVSREESDTLTNVKISSMLTGFDIPKTRMWPYFCKNRSL